MEQQKKISCPLASAFCKVGTSSKRTVEYNKPSIITMIHSFFMQEL